MRYALVTRRATLLMFSKDSGNYTSSVQVNINGDRGTLDTLNGRDFYALLSECGLEPFKRLGLSVVGAAVSEAHYRLIETRLRGKVDVRYVGPTRVGDIELLWVEFTEPLTGQNE